MDSSALMVIAVALVLVLGIKLVFFGKTDAPYNGTGNTGGGSSDGENTGGGTGAGPGPQREEPK